MNIILWLFKIIGITVLGIVAILFAYGLIVLVKEIIKRMKG